MRKRFGKRIISSVLGFLMVIMAVSGVKAERFAKIDYDCYATVVEVIDGDSIKVRVWETGEIGLVRLIGVDSEGNDTAFRYLRELLMGNIVSLTVDSGVKSVEGVWNNLHVAKNGENVSEKLLALGYVKMNGNHSGASNYGVLTESRQSAEDRNAGIWYTEEAAQAQEEEEVYAGTRININTATASQIDSLLSGISRSTANNIVNYREFNVISDVSELKFVEGFTRENFEEYSPMIDVVTNVLSASADELAMLRQFTETDAENIVAFREKNGLISLSTLVSGGLVAAYKYSANLPFISLKDVKTLDYKIPLKSIELNSASKEELVSLGIPDVQAERILSFKDEYTFKSLHELSAMSGGYLTVNEVNKYEDNFILGTYTGYLNLNTATFSQLRSFGLAYADAEAVYAKRGKIYSWADMPTDLTAFDGGITLYTNINYATENELLALSGNMTTDIVKEIVKWREEQPFGSLSEVEDLFESLEMLSVFNSFNKFIVVR